MSRRLSRIFIAVTLFVLAINSRLEARSGSLGLGVIVGNPTGFNLNMKLEADRALDLQLGWSPGSQHFNLSYQIWKARAFNSDGVIFDWYYGFGIHYYFRERDRREDLQEVGLRVPFGLAHHLRDLPAITFFGELGPTINVVEESSFILDFGLGVRYHF
ncbi:MAG: hypothetical protein ACOH5I_07850 [Oligoflexus sp.]